MAPKAHPIPPPELLPMKIPDGRPAVAIDGQPLMLRGWTNGEDLFAFSVNAGPDGKFQAFTVESGKVTHAWPCDTLDEAKGIAAQDYVASTGGPKNAAIGTDEATDGLFWIED